MIQTEDLTKEYRGFRALEGVSLHVNTGEIYGFLGPNGSGKTTSIMLMLGIEKPTSGRVFLFDKELGEHYFEIKGRIGVLGEHQYFYDNLTGIEYLRFFADLYQVREPYKRIEYLLDRVNLSEFSNKKVKTYSRGMQQKLGIIRALIHDPDLLILDEPVSALDPFGILEVRHLLLEENKKGKTIFISSHILSEVEQTAHRVGILLNGHLLAEDTIENLKSRLTKTTQLEIELEEFRPEILAALSHLDFIKNVDRNNRQLIIQIDGDQDFRPRISATITSQNGVIISMNTRKMSLEEAFITITEKNIAELVGK